MHDEYDTRFPDVEEPPLAPARLPQPLRLKPYAAAAGLAALLLLGLLAWHSGGDRTTAIPTTAPSPPPPRLPRP